jgi:hypothetical protein
LHSIAVLLLRKIILQRKKEETAMKMKSMITGVSMAIAAGTVAYAVTEATSSEKKMLKSRTGRAIRAIGDVMDGISMMMK